MGMEYAVFTEAKINGEWVCINGKVKDFETKEDKITSTYWNGSRNYFGETFNKIKDIGKRVEFSELSDEVRDFLRLYTYDESCIACEKGTCKGCDSWDGLYAFAVPVSVLKHLVGDMKGFDKSGFVTEEDIFRYEKEDEDIYEWLSLEDYKELDEESKKLFKAYSWNAHDGWYANLKDIYVNNEYVEYAFFDINYQFYDVETRIVCIAS